jgi:NADH-quinone oxidoreductase subunit K
MIPINQIIALGLIIFSIGLFGVLFRKNLIIILMALELVLNGINIILVGISYYMKSPIGSILAVFVIMVAVAEAAIGFALALSYFRHKTTYDLDEISELKG